MRDEEIQEMEHDAKNGAPERFDYDNLWKTILHHFFWEALKIFLPALYEAADRTKEPEFLDKELQKVTFDLEGGPNRADLLTRVKLKNGEGELILCHTEIQGEGGGDMPVRMNRYRQMICLRYREEPVGIAVMTAPRPRGEQTSYRWERFGVRVLYEYINVVLMDLEDEALLEEENRVGLVLYAAKCLQQSGNDEEKKFRYLRRISTLWAERGWNSDDKRIILNAVSYLMNLRDEDYAKRIVAHVEVLQMNQEDREMYVSVFERVYTARGKEEGLREGELKGLQKGLREGRLEVAQNMLRDGMPVDKVVQYTRLSKEKVETLLNK
ncbi:MAG: hypothetical protein LBR61_02795 [Synergistaceae bacterium]|jgi:hypothetical protein|nr:hypothetical protein [Synergistaceae bacterium]